MPRVLLVVSGGIAAYKALDIARQLRREGAEIIPVMTAAAKAFITPLSLEVLCGAPVQEALLQPGRESDVGHVALARSADLVLVCPATANLMARMAHGLADDLPSTILLATDAPILIAPAMNPHMWSHPATQANLALLRERGVHVVGPASGNVACGETGTGRLASPEDILTACRALLPGSAPQAGGTHGPRPEATRAASTPPAGALASGPASPLPLKGRRVLVTAGPTVEPIDPVRFISNHSSGLQGYAIAGALAAQGAEVRLVSGPVALPTPPGVTRIDVQTAEEMKAACLAQLPADAAICVAAVSDWRPAARQMAKMKKTADGPPALALVENPDILATLSRMGEGRPALVVGFAAETDNLQHHAQEKRSRKGCDWLLANDVTRHHFGGARNQVLFLTGESVEAWPEMDKPALAARLADRVAAFFRDRD